jgi:folate-binding protein YgfZ
MTEASQLDAILHAAAFAPITDKAFLRITGPDATRWLNGMVTNNIKDLAPGQGNYNFLLNAQGRIQGDCTIYREYREPETGNPRFLLETDIGQLEAIHQLLDKFIIMDDVELSTTLDIYGRTVQGEKLQGFILVGNQAGELFGKIMCDFAYEFLMLPAPEPGSLIWGTQGANGVDFVLAPPSKTNTYEIWASTSYLDVLRSEFKREGAIEISSETLEQLRILEGRPKYGQDIRDKDLPQETAQTHALNFNKGCYLGQEIVERIHSRGNVHRTFTKFILTGDMPTLPAILEANAKPAGELTSAACIHDEKHGDIIYALGYLRREAQDQPLTYPGGTAVPRT